MTKPCNNCPFRREGGIRLTPERAEEIALCAAPLDGRGATFPCHKTTKDSTGDEGENDRVATDESQHCGGALMFAYTVGHTSQMLRIAERLGMIDRAFADNPDPDNLIFDDVDEMIEANQERVARRKRTR